MNRYTALSHQQSPQPHSGLSRRSFLKQTTGALALAGMSPIAFGAPEAAKKRPLKKGVMIGTIGIAGSLMDKFKAVKAAGFDGVEVNSHMNHDEVLAACQATGLSIPSVCCSTHWEKNLGHPDAAVREAGLEGLKQSLRDAKKFGATSVLFVPGTVSKEFQYDDVYKRSQQELRKAIPLAEDLGVKIALENVWNNFLLSPMEALRYMEELQSPYVGWHFDAGNIMRYGWPEQWVRVLGKRIAKVHLKEFSRSKMNSQGLWKGFDVKFLEGDNNWPEVMKALDEVGYKDWVITEQPGGDSPEGLKDMSERVDKILAS